ncbi:TPA: beta-agarase [Pseudomonas aeruginosa]|nr:beta-agarase [Pseudomonas aeruginosa]
MELRKTGFMIRSRWHLPLLLGLLAVATPLAASDIQQVLFNFVKPMAVVGITLEDADLPSATAEAAPEGDILRRVTFSPAQRPTLRMSPAQGRWDWSAADYVSLRIQNAMSWDMTLEVAIEGEQGALGLQASIELPAGPPQTLLVPLRAVSPEALGMRAGPPMPQMVEGQRVLLAPRVEGSLDRARVGALSLSLRSPQAPQSILLGRFGIRTGRAVERSILTGLIDRYGQYSRADWPEKIRSDEQLRSAYAAEAAQLRDWERQTPARDRFGGLLGGPVFEASGFFRTEKRGGRWWLVTPEGHPFWSLGVNAVTADGSRTYVEGREPMFAELPAEGEPLAAFFGEGDDRRGVAAQAGRRFGHGRWFDFLGANRQRIAPQASADQLAGEWRQRTLERLSAWGFNSLGNWSDPALAAQARMPYSLPLSIAGDYATVSSGFDWWGAMPDPFDPRFAMAAERVIAIAARDHRDDPWLLGYYADNELAWAGRDGSAQARYGLAFGALTLSMDSPAKRAFVKQLKAKYLGHEALAEAWGIELAAWEALEAPGYAAPLPGEGHPAIAEDYSAFLRLYADAYFKTLRDALQWHAPNHLLLGGRFAVSTPEAITSCARYCDLLSFNLYTPLPGQGLDDSLLARLDKPVLISEFHFGSRDRGPFWGGVSEAANERARGDSYRTFLEAALKSPYIVGAHWFQYLDQPASGRLLDGENGHIGLVGITGLPFAGFVDTVRRSNLAALSRLSAMARSMPAVEPLPPREDSAGS